VCSLVLTPPPSYRSSTSSFNRIFSPRLHLHPILTTPEPPNTNPFSWIPHVLSITDNEYLSTSGLDALMATKFHQTLAKILCTCGVFGLCVLAPIYKDGSVLEDQNNACRDEYDQYNKVSEEGRGGSEKQERIP